MIVYCHLFAGLKHRSGTPPFKYYLDVYLIIHIYNPGSDPLNHWFPNFQKILHGGHLQHTFFLNRVSWTMEGYICIYFTVERQGLLKVGTSGSDILDEFWVAATFSGVRLILFNKIINGMAPVPFESLLKHRRALEENTILN